MKKLTPFEFKMLRTIVILNDSGCTSSVKDVASAMSESRHQCSATIGALIRFGWLFRAIGGEELIAKERPKETDLIYRERTRAAKTEPAAKYAAVKSDTVTAKPTLVPKPKLIVEKQPTLIKSEPTKIEIAAMLKSFVKPVMARDLPRRIDSRILAELDAYGLIESPGGQPYWTLTDKGVELLADNRSKIAV